MQYVRSYVLPVAMQAAGYGMDPQRAHAFFDAYTRGGWPRLQEAMLRDPQIPGPLGDPGLKGKYAITDILADLQELEMYRAEARSRQESRARANPTMHRIDMAYPVPTANASPEYYPPPGNMGALYPTSPYGNPPDPNTMGGSTPLPNGPIMNAMAPTLSPSTQHAGEHASSLASSPASAVAPAPWCTHNPPHLFGSHECPPPAPTPYTPPAAPPDSRPMIQKMDAEDIASASSPYVPENPGQGHVLGNVMHVPPGMEHHLKDESDSKEPK